MLLMHIAMEKFHNNTQHRIKFDFPFFNLQFLLKMLVTLLFMYFVLQY